MKYKLISEEDDGKIVDDIELTHYEFKQAASLKPDGIDTR